MSQDLMDLYADNVPEAEASCGMAGNETPAQWAVAHIEDTKAMRSRDKGTPGVELNPFRLDDVDALTPKRRIPFIRVWVSPPRPQTGDDKGSQGTKAQINGWLAACGRKKLATGVQITKGNAEMIAQSLAGVLKGSTLIIHGRIRKQDTGDTFDIDGMHPVTERNLAAIREAHFEDGGVEVKTRTENGVVVERWLAAKKRPAGKGAAAGAQAASGVVV